MVLYFKLIDLLNRIVEYIICLLLILMVLTVFSQVLFRYIIHSPLPWSEELARYILIWISFLGASIGVKRHVHIGVSAITSLLQGKARKLISLLIPSLSTIFFLFLSIYGYRILDVVAYQLSPAMEISMAIPYSAVTVSGTLMFLYSTSDVLKFLTGNRDESP